jgi:NTE family protein
MGSAGRTEVINGMAERHGGKLLNLALQGGGAHGAFTWGALEALTEEATLDVTCISATSAGAVNAVAYASGYAKGGAPEARAALEGIWTDIERAALPDFMRTIARASLASITSIFSPYEFNPLGFDPLRNILKAHIDFEAVRHKAPFELLIAATDASTGRAKLFRKTEIDVEAVLASTCLPSLHKAVEVNGAHYWDGGFSANPDLVTLTGSGFAHDTLLVKLNPLVNPTLPTSAAEIAGRVNRITFNQPLLRDIALIDEAQRHMKIAAWCSSRRWRCMHRHRFHLIDAEPYTRGLPPGSSLEPDGELFRRLRTAGRNEGRQWLATAYKSVGRRATADLAGLFLGRPRAASLEVPSRAP